MIDIATVVSKYYIDRISCLIDSLEKFDSKLHILCFDQDVLNKLKKKKYKNIELYYVDKIFEFDVQLNQKIQNIELINQVVMSRPVFIKYLNRVNNINKICLIDSDTYFFSNPDQILNETKSYSIAFCKHNFNRNENYLEKNFGKFNAGYIYFNLDNYGLKFLNDWSELCKDWCLFEPSDNKFSDQKYLEKLYDNMKENIKIIDNPGYNLAPWNLENKKINKKDKIVYVDSYQLVFFHFHGIKKLFKKIYFLGLTGYECKIQSETKKIIYKDYINLLNSYETEKEFYWKHSTIGINQNLSIKSFFKKTYNLINKFRHNDFQIKF